MYRYFVLIWNTRNIEAAAAARSLCERLGSVASGWVRAYEAEGVCAFHAGLGEGASGTALLDHRAGAVFGRIFNRDIDNTARAVGVEFDATESLQIVRS